MLAICTIESLWHNIIIPNQTSLCSYHLVLCVEAKKQQIAIFEMTGARLIPRYTTLEVRTQTILAFSQGLHHQLN